MPKTAICFSGELRSLDKTFELIEKNILSKFSDYDIFYFGWKDDPDIDKVKILLETGKVSKIFLEDRLSFMEDTYFTGIRNEKIHYQNILRQFYCLQRVNDLKCEVEQSEGFIYDIVVRIRPDLYLLDDSKLSNDFENGDFSYLHVLNHDRWHGTCDRFYVTSSKNMDILANRINLLKSFTKLGYDHQFHEAFLKFSVIMYDIEEKYIETLKTCLLRTSGKQEGELIAVKNGEIRMDGTRIFHLELNCYV